MNTLLTTSLLLMTLLTTSMTATPGLRPVDTSEAAELAQLVRDLEELYWLNEAAKEAEAEPAVMAAVKRGPAFSSWAGRKRAAFSAWAGKRGGGDYPVMSYPDIKRAAFSAWAGKKRSDVDESVFDDHNRNKRSSDEDDAHRVRRGVKGFSAWGGKRNQGAPRYARNAPNMRVVRPNRAAFSAWGGR